MPSQMRYVTSLLKIDASLAMCQILSTTTGEEKFAYLLTHSPESQQVSQWKTKSICIKPAECFVLIKTNAFFITGIFEPPRVPAPYEF